MKLATFTHGGATRIGVVVEDSIVDLAAATTELPREMIAFLIAGPRAIDRAAGAAKNSAHRIALSERQARGAYRAARRSFSPSGSTTPTTSKKPR